jgi:hypothetical protein
MLPSSPFRVPLRVLPLGSLSFKFALWFDRRINRYFVILNRVEPSSQLSSRRAT